MADNISALLGMGLSPQDDMQALAKSLRGEQAVGDYFSGSSSQKMAQYGQRLADRSTQAAQRGGVLKQAMNRENTRQGDLARSQGIRRDERQEDYERAQAAAKLKAQGALNLQGLKNQKTSPDNSFKVGQAAPYVMRDDGGKKASLYFDPNSGKYLRTDTGKPVEINKWKPEPEPKKMQDFDKADIDKFEKIAGSFENLTQLRDSFSTSYSAGQEKNVPFQSTAGVWLGQMFPSMSSDELRDSGEWWRNVDKFNTLAERHALFGGALTQNEAKSWARANISPENTPEQVMRSLTTLIDKKRTELTRRAKAYKIGRYDPDIVDLYFTDIIKQSEAMESGGAPNPMGIPQAGSTDLGGGWSIQAKGN